MSVMKVVCPGARSGRLLAEVAYLQNGFSFGHVVVSVGANYLPGPFNRHLLSPESIATEINSLLDEIGNVYRANVTFSCILPQRDMSTIEFINRINNLVCDHCWPINIGILQCMDFQLDISLLANDGTHLSWKGIEAMFKCLCDHIIYIYK